MSYTMDKYVQGEFDTVVEQTTDDLADEGFDILCDIDVQRTLKEKLRPISNNVTNDTIIS